jgi:hypothetical protein
VTTLRADTDGVSEAYTGQTDAFANGVPDPFVDDYEIILAASTGVVDVVNYQEWARTRNGYTLTVKAATGDEAAPDEWKTSRYRMASTVGQYCMIESYFWLTFEGLQIDCTSGQDYWLTMVFYSGATFRNCRIRFSSNGIQAAGGTARFENCIFENTAASDRTALVGAAGTTFEVDQCIFGEDTIPWNGTGSLTGKNSILLDLPLPTAGTWDNTGIPSGTLGTDSVTPLGSDIDNELADVTTGDYSIQAGGNYEDAGDPIVGLMLDMLGNSWDATNPSIGVEQIQGGGFVDGDGTLGSVSGLLAAGGALRSGSGGLGSVSALDAIGAAIRAGDAALASVSGLSAAGQVSGGSEASLGSISRLRARGSAIRIGAGTLWSVSALAAAGEVAGASSASLASTSRLMAAGSAIRSGVGALASVSELIARAAPPGVIPTIEVLVGTASRSAGVFSAAISRETVASGSIEKVTALAADVEVGG